MRLVYKATGKPVEIDDRHTIGIFNLAVDHMPPPHKPESEGKITFRVVGDSEGYPGPTYYCSVIGAHWIERDDRNGLACTYEEFKRIAVDFLKAAPTAPTLESLDAGHKCVSLAFLNCEHENTALGRHYQTTQAPFILGMCTKEFVLREIELQRAGAST